MQSASWRQGGYSLGRLRDVYVLDAGWPPGVVEWDRVASLSARKERSNFTIIMLLSSKTTLETAHVGVEQGQEAGAF